MANAKAIKKKRKTAQNIHKITKTMELVATAKLKTANFSYRSVQRYQQIVQEMLSKVAANGISHPLLEQRPSVSRVALLVIAGHKGLCGNYNFRIIQEVLAFKEQAAKEGKKLDIHVVGRKGIQQLKFRNVIPTREYTSFPDQPRLNQIDSLIDGLIKDFESHEVDQVWTIYMRKLRIKRELLLPFSIEEGKSVRDQYLYWPDSSTIAAAFLPHYGKLKVFEMFLQAAISEQTSRMLAMKMATENAEEMIKRLTRQYNRARQTQITKEILEIMGGANALK